MLFANSAIIPYGSERVKESSLEKTGYILALAMKTTSDWLSDITKLCHDALVTSASSNKTVFALHLLESLCTLTLLMAVLRSTVGRAPDLQVRSPGFYTQSGNIVSPFADSRGAVVSYWQKDVLVNHFGGLSLPRKSVVRLTDRPDMTLDVYHGCKTTTQQQQFF